MNAKRREELIEGITQRVEEWGLAVPATFFFELIKPLSFVGGQMLLLARPLLGDGVQEYALLLEERSSIERILTQLGRQRADPSPNSR